MSQEPAADLNSAMQRELRRREFRMFVADVRVDRDANVTEEDLDADDRDLQPQYSVEFAAPINASDESKESLALDEFHETVPISCLDHFTCYVKTVQPVEVPPTESLTPYADLFVEFQKTLGNFDQAVRQLVAADDLETAREVYQRASLDVLRCYNRALTTLQLNRLRPLQLQVVTACTPPAADHPG